MKINPTNYLSAKEISAENKSKLIKNEENVNLDEIPKSSLSEAIGRSQVHFKGGKSELINLTLADKKFISFVEKVFRLEEKESSVIKDFTEEFLRENKFRSMQDMHSEDFLEFANETAYWLESISKKLNLTDQESDGLSWLLTFHVGGDDLSKCHTPDGRSFWSAFRYTRDITPFESVLEKYGISHDNCAALYRDLTKIADKNDLYSLFNLFDETNIKNPSLKNFISKRLGEDAEKVSDILIDLYSLAKKGEKERLEGINIHKASETFEDGINALVIANKIDDKFHTGITKWMLELLSKRETGSQASHGGISTKEIAYKIADKLDLAAGSEKEIEAIIEKYNNANGAEQFNNISEALRKET